MNGLIPAIQYSLLQTIWTVQKRGTGTQSSLFPAACSNQNHEPLLQFVHCRVTMPCQASHRIKERRSRFQSPPTESSNIWQICHFSLLPMITARLFLWMPCFTQLITALHVLRAFLSAGELPRAESSCPEFSLRFNSLYLGTCFSVKCHVKPLQPDVGSGCNASSFCL